MSITPVSGYGVTKFIVSTDAGQGTHTTLASAMAAASSGDTIFLRTSVTENVTITPGVNIVAWDASSLNTPTITGNLTMSGAGTSEISGLILATNSANIITVSGSAASILNVKNCYLNCSNNTGISYTSSSSSSSINLQDCFGNLGTTGIALFSHSSAGTLEFRYCKFSNSGGSTTASTASAGALNFYWSFFTNPVTTSSTATLSSAHSLISCSNTTALTVGSGGGGSNSDVFLSGTASAISTAGTLTLTNANVSSSNTNAITGAGLLAYNTIDFFGASRLINTTTQSCFNGGSFTPVIAFGGASVGITYGTQLGVYRRSGNNVHFSIMIATTSKGSSTGTMTISGLPIAAAANGITYEFPMYYQPIIALATVTGFFADLAASATSMTLLFETAATGTYGLLDNNVAANVMNIRISGTYFV